MPLKTRQFRKNQGREGRTFLVNVNEITRTCLPWNHTAFLGVKNAFVVYVLRHNLQHL
jgi:hypothetical protein